MLSPKMMELFAQIEKLPMEEQESLADELYADLLDTKFRRKLEAGEPMPALEALVAQAEGEIARGEYVDLDQWLEEDEDDA